MSVFWPGKLNPSPSIVVYVGRVLHWMGCAIALAVCVYGIYCVGYSFQLLVAHKPTGSSLTLAFGIFMIGTGVLVFFLGRALRYVFSRE